MSQSLQVNNTEYVKASTAARAVGYTSDYVGRLAREKKILATQVGRQWFIDLESLKQFISTADKKKSEQRKKLRSVRKAEHLVHQSKVQQSSLALAVDSHSDSDQKEISRGVVPAIVATLAVVLSGIGIGTVSVYGTNTPAVLAEHMIKQVELESLAVAVYTGFSPAGDQSMASSPVARGVSVDGSAEGGTDHTAPIVDSVSSGLVVMDGAVSEATVAAVRDSFSDEVAVEVDPVESDTGLVTPIFRERSGDSYRFLLVPVEAGP